MSDLLLAPYLNVTAPVTVGPWSLVPFRALKQEDDEAAAESRTWLLRPFALLYCGWWRRIASRAAAPR